jgi:Pre-toxin domain with VENN motif
MVVRKNLIIALLTLFAVILAGINTGSPNLVTSASSQDNAVENEVVFSIPVGDNGIHYEGTENPER